MFASMTAKELYRNFLLRLQSIYALGEATAITDRAFEAIAGIRRQELVKHPQQQFTAAINEELEKALHELLQHRPVQYVLQEAWFFHLKLKVNESVLIPRPETEELVQWLLNDLQQVYQVRQTGTPRPAGIVNIIDIGTGSGCIPIAIKKKLPAANITAVDYSTAALTLAKENAASHHCDINFIETDFLKEDNWSSLPQSDIIISNPPYIPEQEKEQLDKNVLAWEPHLALFVPDNKALIFYEKIAAFGRKYLSPQGQIYLETHAPLAQEVANLFRKEYSAVTVKKDMFGLERFVKAVY